MGVFQGTANYIKFMVTDRCARPWFVYAETFLPAFLELLLTIFFLELNDIVRAYGESIAEGGGGKKGRRKRHTPKIKTLGARTEVERYMQKGLKTLLVVTQPLENIGYAWLLTSAVDDFFYDWQTLIEQAPYCTKNDQWGPLHRSRGSGFITILPGGFPIIMTNLDQNRSSWPTTTISAEVPAAQNQVVFAATIGAPPGGITGVYIRVKVTDGFSDTFFESDKQDIPEGALRDFVIMRDYFVFSIGGAAVTWELVGPAVPAGIYCDKARVIMFRSS
jgi:hypothetical protein